MDTKKIKRKRFNILKFLFVILVLYILINIVLKVLDVPIKNIIIKNNSYYTDEKIIETAKIEKYPSFLKISNKTIEKRLKKLDLVKDVKIKKQLGFIMNLEINEYKILYRIRSNGNYVLENGRELALSQNILGIPVLINFVPDEVLKKMNNDFSLLSRDIISKISEIEYAPTTYDLERFLLYMNDKNEVYITLSKVENLNKYVSIKEKIGTKQGILYLDSGNYFEEK